MSRLPEQRLWDRMRQALLGLELGRFYLERYENLVGVGGPDTLVLHQGVVTWVELKQVESPPARAATRLIPSGKGLSRDQMNWHLSWRQNGGRSMVLVGLERSELFLVPNTHTDELNLMTRERMREVSLARNWIEVAEVLKGKR